MTELDIYRGTSIWLTIKTDDNTRLISQILSTDIIKSSFNSHIFLDINIGDYIVYGGVIYHINSLPNIKKNSTNSYDYDITFESESYELLKTQFLDKPDGNSDFYLVGNPETFIDLIVDNMNREHTDWMSLTRTQTNHDYKLLSFSKNNCMQVLQKLCVEFEGEFYFEFALKFTEAARLPYVAADSAVVGYKPLAEAKHGYKPAEGGIVTYTKDICFTNKAGEEHPELIFRYHQGLRNIHKTTLSEKNIVTRLYAFGSRKNLKSNYRNYSRRLKLPTGLSYLEKYITATTWEATTTYDLGDIIKSLTPNDYYYECTETGDSGEGEPEWGITEGGTTEDGTVVWTCRVDPVDKYGIIEHTEIFEDIYPHREGKVSYVGEDITKFRDTYEDPDPIMFDLNAHLLPGVTAKVHFNSGDLGGYEFEISNYDHTEGIKEFTIIAFSDDQGHVMPNDDLKPKIGDKYVLIDIFLPDSYIEAAETALQIKAQAYLDDNCEPRVTYILEPDWRSFKDGSIKLKAGDFIKIEDDDLGIDVMTRIVELTKSVANEYKYTLKLTDHLEVQLIQRLYSEQEDLKEKIEIGYGGDIIRSRRNWKTSEELRTMVFDTDGCFNMEKIRPLSIETGMLSVGTESTQFILREVQIEANYQSDVSRFHTSAGQLIHYVTNVLLSIEDEIGTWTLSENTEEDLVNEKAYYIYAECTKEEPYAGKIIVDEEQRKFDDDPTHYYFLVGVLHSVIEEVRGVSLTYGQTIINGRFIRTGKIESTDGLTYFDLDNSVIQGKIQFITNTSGYDNISDKPDLSIYDAKAKVFRQPAKPTEGMQEGDIWIDTDDGDKPRTYNGDDWVLMYTIIDGGNIETGSIVANRLNITNLADIANMVLGDPGYIRTTGKDSYESTVAGFWLGHSEGYKLNIGDATHYLKWTGSALQVKGLVSADALSAINANIGNITAGNIRGTRFQVGGGTNEDIYFEDSKLRLYDVGGQCISLTRTGYSNLDIGVGSDYVAISTLDYLFTIAAGAKEYGFYSTGQLQLPDLSDLPTENLAEGQLCMWLGRLWAYRDGDWEPA